MKKILVIDPSVQDFEAAKSILMYAGYQLYHCRDSNLLSLMVAEHKPDILLIEFLVPGRSFLSVMRDIKASDLLSCLPIIGTSRDAGANKTAALTLGATTYISKPYNMSELIQAISQV